MLQQLESERKLLSFFRFTLQLEVLCFLSDKLECTIVTSVTYLFACSWKYFSLSLLGQSGGS